jgi:hypothetical protein
LLNFATFAPFAEALPCVTREEEEIFDFACKKPTGKRSAKTRAGRGKILKRITNLS